MTPARVKMATLPEKTEPIQNPVGTAPAVRLDLNGTVLFALPGVPSEMEAIFTETLNRYSRSCGRQGVLRKKHVPRGYYGVAVGAAH